MFKVVEIFCSIEGEGKRAGILAQFIRLAGCNLACSYCDTKYAWDARSEDYCYKEMSLEDIVSRLRKDVKAVTITGGEPLLVKNVDSLIAALVNEGYAVNIETNGAVDLTPFVNRYDGNRLFFTVDYKLPSSNMEKFMIPQNFTILSESDVIKYVVGSDDDVQSMLSSLADITKFYGEHNLHMPQIYVGVVWNMFPAEKLVEIMKSNGLLNEAHLQLQLHKFIWEPNKKGV